MRWIIYITIFSAYINYIPNFKLVSFQPTEGRTDLQMKSVWEQVSLRSVNYSIFIYLVVNT